MVIDLLDTEDQAEVQNTDLDRQIYLNLWDANKLNNYKGNLRGTLDALTLNNSFISIISAKIISFISLINATIIFSLVSYEVPLTCSSNYSCPSSRSSSYHSHYEHLHLEGLACLRPMKHGHSKEPCCHELDKI